MLKAAGAGGGSGILIGDGSTLWIYWPDGRFNYGDDPKTYEKTRLTSYMTKPAPPGGHSIGHETGFLGAGMSMPIIDPSTFFGYTDSLQPYLDGVKSLGTEKVGTEDCDKIEVSIMKHQRSWYLWIAKSDHLPRKLKEIVRVSYDLIIREDWSSVTINGDIPDKLFAWKPPKGWTRVEEAFHRGRAVEARHESPGLRSGFGRGKADQAVGLPGPGRMVLCLEGWLTDLPRGDVSSPRTLCEVQEQGIGDPRLRRLGRQEDRLGNAP